MMSRIRILAVAGFVLVLVMALVWAAITLKDGIQVRSAAAALTAGVKDPLQLLMDETQYEAFLHELKRVEGSAARLERDLSYQKLAIWPWEQLPWVGPRIKGAKALLRMVRRSAQSAELAIEAYRPLVPLEEELTQQAAKVEATLMENRPKLLEAREFLVDARTVRRSALKDPPGLYDSYVQQFDGWSGVLGDFIDVSLTTPSLLLALPGLNQTMEGLSKPPFDLEDPLPLADETEKIEEYSHSLKEAAAEVEELLEQGKEVRLFRQENDGPEVIYGPLLPLLEAAFYSLNGAVEATEAALNLAALMDVPTYLTPEFGEEAQRLIPEAQRGVARAQKLVKQAVNLVDGVEGLLGQGAFRGSLKSAALPLREAEGRVETLARVLHMLRFALGLDAPRTYLILGQDEDELRPTGGFIGVVQEVLIEGGVLKETTFKNSYDVDTGEATAFTLKVSPVKLMPEPFAKYLFGVPQHPWYFRDTNWWPDFPTSAVEVAQSYRRATDISLDGVFGTTQDLTVELVDALGGVEVEGVEGPVYGMDARQYINGTKDYPVRQDHISRQPHRAFIQDLSQAILDRFQQGLSPDERREALRVIARALQEKELLVYLFDAESRTALRSLNWDGAIPLATQDYLFVAESNMIACKCSQDIERRIHYQVQLDGNGGGEALLRLLYRNPLLTGRQVYDQFPGSRRAAVGIGYWAYLTIYIPERAKLLDSSALPLPEGTLYESKLPQGEVPKEKRSTLTLADREDVGKTEMGFFVLVKEEELKELEFSYSLPTVIVKTEDGTQLYQLYLQKQAGVPPVEVEVEVVLPPSRQLVEATPEPQDVVNNRLTFLVQLDKDRTITVEFK